MLIPLLLSGTLLALPQGRGHDKPGKGLPPGLAKKEGLPPGLAKQGGLPPGLARKFGRRLPVRPCIAVDPRHTDRAWFLIEGRWELRRGLEVGVQAELRDLLLRPAAPPPVPLPRVGIDLHVVLFN